MPNQELTMDDTPSLNLALDELDNLVLCQKYACARAVARKGSGPTQERAAKRAAAYEAEIRRRDLEGTLGAR